MSTRQTVNIVETTPVKKDDYRAVLGFAGAGFIGNTSTMFVVSKKKFPQVAYVKSNYIPPMTFISNGVPTQSFRIYINEENKILFTIWDSLVPTEDCWPIAEALLKWIKEKNTNEIYAIEGLPFNTASSELKALVYSNKIDLSNQGYPPIREGAISGINSCILDDCVEKGFPYACLFIPTMNLTSVDYTASADAVDVLNKLFGFGVDPSPLRRVNEKKATEQKQSGLGRVFKKG